VICQAEISFEDRIGICRKIGRWSQVGDGLDSIVEGYGSQPDPIPRP
jgi:hypothetical protein